MNSQESRLVTMLAIKHLIEELLKQGIPTEVILEKMDKEIGEIIKGLPKKNQILIKTTAERINLKTDALIEEELG